MDATLQAWLLDSDPALRWQVERDLLGAPEATWQGTRARVATEGYGARLLALQDEDGQWAGVAGGAGDTSRAGAIPRVSPVCGRYRLNPFNGGSGG